MCFELRFWHLFCDSLSAIELVGNGSPNPSRQANAVRIDKGEVMNKPLTLAAGIGLGTGIMYLLDPDRGKRRRALVRDRIKNVARKTSHGVGVTARDVTNRARGLGAQIQSRLKRDKAEVDDDVLRQRVRSKLGRIVSHPSAITTIVDGGKVTLSGPVLRHEVDDLLQSVSGVKGVENVENQLEVHNAPGDIPALQGGRTRPGNRMEFMQEHWSPAARFAAGASGAALAVYGGKRRDALGAGVGAAGLLLLARGLTNLELKRLTGLGGGREAITIQKTLNVDAPLERVFGLWSDYETFPLFMSNVEEVRSIGDNRTHWKVAGPAGVPIEWDAVTTRLEPNQILAWKTEPGSVVDHAGLVKFEANEDGSTRIDVKLSYNPPAGAIGHGVAALLGVDPKADIDDDLMRMKNMLETGQVPHDTAQTHAM